MGRAHRGALNKGILRCKFMHIHNEKEKHFILLPFSLSFSLPLSLSTFEELKRKFIYSISMLFLCAFMRSFHIFSMMLENLLPLLPQLMNAAFFHSIFSIAWKAAGGKKSFNKIDFQVVFIEFLIASQFQLWTEFPPSSL